MTAFMDRLFYSELGGNGNRAFYMKPLPQSFLPDGPELQQLSTSSINTLPFKRCRWYLPATGIWFMGQVPIR